MARRAVARQAAVVMVVAKSADAPVKVMSGVGGMAEVEQGVDCLEAVPGVAELTAVASMEVERTATAEAVAMARAKGTVGEVEVAAVGLVEETAQVVEGKAVAAEKAGQVARVVERGS